MKTKFLLLPLLFALSFTSCKKDKVKALPYYGPLERLVADYIAANPSVTINTTTTIDLPLEYGIVFQSSKKGIITGLGVRMPLAGEKYTVSLWDYDTKQLLKQYEVNNIITSGFNYIDMEVRSETIAIAANKKYVASVFVKAAGQPQPWPYYYMLKPGAGSALNYIPFTRGSLTCVGTQFTRNATPSFPDQQVLHADIMNGLCDISFKATEK
ncbi:MAG: DUF4082 domain-containing protein [Sphingobacteriales bacterium]|nr:DUF4082 domain-containing protein [Sphingobacteriales bacterium]